MLVRSRSREYSREAFASVGTAMASVRARVGPPPALITSWQKMMATAGIGALRPMAKMAAGMHASCSVRRGPLTMSPMWPQAGSAIA